MENLWDFEEAIMNWTSTTEQALLDVLNRNTPEKIRDKSEMEEVYMK